MSILKAVGLALMGADEQSEVVSIQNILGNVGPEVTASAPETVGCRPLDILGVAPQDVQHLDSTRHHI